MRLTEAGRLRLESRRQETVDARGLRVKRRRREGLEARRLHLHRLHWAILLEALLESRLEILLHPRLEAGRLRLHHRREACLLWLLWRRGHRVEARRLRHHAILLELELRVLLALELWVLLGVTRHLLLHSLHVEVL